MLFLSLFNSIRFAGVLGLRLFALFLIFLMFLRKTSDKASVRALFGDFVYRFFALFWWKNAKIFLRLGDLWDAFDVTFCSNFLIVSWKTLSRVILQLFWGLLKILFFSMIFCKMVKYGNSLSCSGYLCRVFDGFWIFRL